ncbi:MAG TPA: SOS response-associated peptidase [Caldilineaceae bacterium]|nr:SOS response-associated peptidase [Caldilineaceae bacterium]
MCGRFTLNASPEQLAEIFDLPETPVVEPRYNIAPTQPVAIVRVDPQSKRREWALTYWGLVPSWSKDISIGAKLINARADTAPEKPSFRAAFKRRRCLVPATGFYEWQKQGSRKQPYYITMRDEQPFGFAGLWEVWHGADGSELESCTILTTEPNELMATLHNRMPVIIAPEDYADWLGSGGDEKPQALDQLRHLLRAYPAEAMQARPVSTFVNNAQHEGPTCIESLTAPAA